MATFLPIACAGHEFILLPQRALWWPAQSTLFIADPHFGKAATYRALGQPVPSGTTQATLARLDAVLASWPARRLMILGDFLHARQARTPAVLAALKAWRQRHASLACVLVRGNHDDRAGDPPPDLNIEIVDQPCLLAGVSCRHYPPAAGALKEEGVYTLAGHVHPVAVLHGRGGDRARLACFDMGESDGVLPAFGAFTGGHLAAAQEGRRRYVVAEDQIFGL
jgi:DNA ligase-associated metallophosphoesterase